MPSVIKQLVETAKNPKGHERVWAAQSTHIHKERLK